MSLVGAGSIGIRGGFEAFAMSGDGSAFAFVETEVFSAAAPFLLAVSANLVAQRSGGTEIVSLQLIEKDLLAPAQSVADVQLSPSMAAAVLVGMPFTIDLWVDRGMDTAQASIMVQGFTTPIETQLGLTASGVPESVGVIQEAGMPPLGLAASSMQVDMTRLEVYSASQPALNIDLGVYHGPASPSYGAAGQVGTWNEAPIGSTSLVDVDALATAVEIDATADLLGGFSAGVSDARVLLGDMVYSCIPKDWSLSLTGLPLGRYEVTVYAPAHSSVATGDLLVGSTPLPSMNGDTGFALIEGTSWARTQVEIVDSTLSISGSGGALACAGLAGLQITPIPPTPVVPASGPFGLFLLAVLSVLAARAAGRSASTNFA